MRIELTEMLWFEEHVISLPELAELSGLPRELLEELVRCGAIAPLDSSEREPRFGASALVAARNARRLRTDFELDLPALLLVLGLLERVNELGGRVRELQAKSPRWIR